MKFNYWKKNYTTAKINRKIVASIAGEGFSSEECQKKLAQISAKIDEHNYIALKMAAKTTIKQSGEADLTEEFQEYRKKIEFDLKKRNLNENAIATVSNIIISSIFSDDISEVEVSKTYINGTKGHIRKFSNLRFISIPKVLEQLVQLAILGKSIVTGDYMNAVAILISEVIFLSENITVELTEIQVLAIRCLYEYIETYRSLEDILCYLKDKGHTEVDKIKEELVALLEYGCITVENNEYRLKDRISINI